MVAAMFTRDTVVSRLKAGDAPELLEGEDAIERLADEIAQTLKLGEDGADAIRLLDSSSVEDEVALAEKMAREFAVTDLEIAMMYVKAQLVQREPGTGSVMDMNEEDYMFCRYMGGDTPEEARAQLVVPELFKYKIPRSDIEVCHKAALAWSEVVRERFYNFCHRGHTNDHMINLCAARTPEEMREYVLANNPKFAKKPETSEAVLYWYAEAAAFVGAWTWPASVGAGTFLTTRSGIERDTDYRQQRNDIMPFQTPMYALPLARAPANLPWVGRLHHGYPAPTAYPCPAGDR